MQPVKTSVRQEYEYANDDIQTVFKLQTPHAVNLSSLRTVVRYDWSDSEYIPAQVHRFH
jgi:uncharacterized protein (UPF0333 family)